MTSDSITSALPEPEGRPAMRTVPEGMGPIYHAGVVTVLRFGDQLVVEEADPYVCISSELLRHIVEGHSALVGFGEGVLTFGTEGEGLGVVTYEIDDPAFMDWYKGRRSTWETPWLTMRRIA